MSDLTENINVAIDVDTDIDGDEHDFKLEELEIASDGNGAFEIEAKNLESEGRFEGDVNVALKIDYENDRIGSDDGDDK
ncbi:MAG: hypothetical protein ABEN55_11300 [Bradymonadaceae bacterium]